MTAATLRADKDMARGQDTPQRRCLVTRESEPRDRLLRFVVGPDNTVVPDLAERLPGRGLWLTAQRDIVTQAAAKNAFARAARAPVTVPADLADRIADLLERRCGDLLALANRAGLVIAGYEKVRAALRSGKVALLLTASDSKGQDAAALRRGAAERAGPTVMTSEMLGRALGREAAVNVALIAGALTGQLLRELKRLAGFRQADAPAGADAADRTEPPMQVNG
jgi:predicted RNA-binding protein YlxR (DUF448 family)